MAALLKPCPNLIEIHGRIAGCWRAVFGIARFEPASRRLVHGFESLRAFSKVDLNV